MKEQILAFSFLSNVTRTLVRQILSKARLALLLYELLDNKKRTNNKKRMSICVG